MRAFKISLALILVLGSAVLGVLTYLQNHGAGISTGILLALVTVCYFVDHRHHIFGIEASAPDGSKSKVRTVALRQGRLQAMHQDGAFDRRG